MEDLLKCQIGSLIKYHQNQSQNQSALFSTQTSLA